MELLPCLVESGCVLSDADGTWDTEALAEDGEWDAGGAQAHGLFVIGAHSVGGDAEPFAEADQGVRGRRPRRCR